MSKSGFVAIVGRPNAGKSTLLNSVLGMELSIVSAKAQTTRDKVLGILTEPEGQIVFVDTPGIHNADLGGINERMVGVAKEALDGPSVAWYLLDPKSELKHEETVLEILKEAGAPVFLILNKTDTLRGAVNRERGETLLNQIRAAAEAKGISIEQTFLISALEKEGLKKLLASTWERLEEGPRYFEDEDQVSDRPTKFFVAEMIREQLMLRLGEEVPYSCAVEISKFDEKAKPVRIEAIIFVERESQKGIVVGKGGAKIKEIGQNARAKIETFLGHQIFLGLQVKLLKDWTKDADALKRMGYDEPKKQKRRESLK